MEIIQSADAPLSNLPPLLPHQIEGIKWMRENEKCGRGGAIIADTPGLGKTRMLLYHTLDIFSGSNLLVPVKMRIALPEYTANNISPLVLIITPLSLCHQWRTELVEKIFGNTTKKQQREISQSLLVVDNGGPQCIDVLTRLIEHQQQQVCEGVVQTADNPHIESEDVSTNVSKIRTVICGYHRFALLQPYFARLVWRYLILDEADMVRTEDTILYKALQTLRRGIVYCITATPINNKWQDVKSLCKIIGDKPYSTNGWWQQRHKSIDQANANHRIWLMRYVRQCSIDCIKCELPPFTKQQVLCPLLPIEQRWIKLLQGHKIKNTYPASHLTCCGRIRRALVHPSLVLPPAGQCNEDDEEEVLARIGDAIKTERDIGTVFDSPDSGKKRTNPCCWICSGPALYVSPTCTRSHFSCRPMSFDVTSVGDDTNNNNVCIACEMMNYPLDAGSKFQHVLSLVEEILGAPESLNLRTPSGRLPRILIFSQWSRSLDLLQIFLKQYGYNSEIIHGQQKKPREEAKSDFQNNPTIRILLMSIKVGCAGWDLSCAQCIISLDEPFNYANVVQRDRRCYRLGQIDPTFSISMLVPGVPEETEIIEKYHKQKYKISRTILTDANNSLITTQRRHKNHKHTWKKNTIKRNNVSIVQR